MQTMPIYTYHFNPANSSSLGDNGTVGGDYYYTYGDALFMILNTQDTNVEEHRQFVESTVAANTDCKMENSNTSSGYLWICRTFQ